MLLWLLSQVLVQRSQPMRENVTNAIWDDIEKLKPWLGSENQLPVKSRQFGDIGQWVSCQIRKSAACACAGNTGNVTPRRRIQRKPLISDTGMHHGTCVTHVPWCMSGSLTRGGGENVPGIPGACAYAIWRICQEAHGASLLRTIMTGLSRFIAWARWMWRRQGSWF